MIEFSHVDKKYGAVTALRDVSFRVEKGETLGLLGRNGAGKSTALNVMTGYFPPTSGTVLIDGVDMMDDPRTCKRKMGYLPERPPLYDEMTVIEYLIFACELMEVVRSERLRHAEAVMEICGLADMRNRTLGRLSRGYRQRAGIAQALCGNPEILVLDEPTVGLDPRQTVEMRQLILELGKNHTIIFSSHLLAEVQQLCTRVIILREGQLVRSLPLGKSETDAVKLRLRAACGEKKLTDALRALHCVTDVTVISASAGETQVQLSCLPADERGRAEDQLFRKLAEMGAPIREMRPEGDALEEIFLRDTE